MKRFCILLLSLLLLTVLLTGCGKNRAVECGKMPPDDCPELIRENAATDTVLILNLYLNPDFAIYLNGERQVTKVLGVNNDAMEILRSSDLSDMPYGTVLDTLIRKMIEGDYLKAGAEITLDFYEFGDVSSFPNMEIIARTVIENALCDAGVQQVHMNSNLLGDGLLAWAAPDSDGGDDSNVNGASESLFDEVIRNSAGVIVKTVEHDSAGTKVTREYDKDGRAMKETFEKRDRSVMIRELNAEGRLTKMISTAPDGTVEEWTKISASEQCLEAVVTFPNGEVQRHTWTYDAAGQPLTNTIVSDKQKLFVTFKDGKRTREETEDLVNGVTVVTELVDDQVVHLTEKSADGEREEFYQNGVISEVYQKTPKSEVHSWFDANGNRTREEAADLVNGVTAVTELVDDQPVHRIQKSADGEREEFFRNGVVTEMYQKTVDGEIHRWFDPSGALLKESVTSAGVQSITDYSGGVPVTREERKIPGVVAVLTLDPTGNAVAVTVTRNGVVMNGTNPALPAVVRTETDGTGCERGYSASGRLVYQKGITPNGQHMDFYYYDSGVMAVEDTYGPNGRWKWIYDTGGNKVEGIGITNHGEDSHCVYGTDGSPVTFITSADGIIGCLYD